MKNNNNNDSSTLWDKVKYTVIDLFEFIDDHFGAILFTGIMMLLGLGVYGLMEKLEKTVEPISLDQTFGVSPDSDEICQPIESDNSFSWEWGACVKVNTSVYRLLVRVNDDITNVETTNTSGSLYGYGGGYSYGHLRIWEEGKGILPVTVREIVPEFSGITVGDTILLKTVDRKAMGLPNGAITEFICNKSAEVLSPNANGMTLVDERVTFELDDCRMVTPEYHILADDSE